MLEGGKKFHKMDELALLFPEASYDVDAFYDGLPDEHNPYSLQNYVKELERIAEEINLKMNELEEMGLN